MSVQQLFSSLILFLAVFGIKCQLCERQCDCSLREDHKGVTNVKARCSEGKIEWFNPMGSIRLDINPNWQEEFEACFIVHTSYTKLKVSSEKNVNDESSLDLTPLFTAVGVMQSIPYCIKSTHLESIHLYMESEKLTSYNGVTEVVIQYHIQKINKDVLEECRPCEDFELITAYCSSDFVVEGSLLDVQNDFEASTTNMKIKVDRIIQQRKKLFHRTKRTAGSLQGTVTAPLKCQIQKGPGRFLFTGTLRFGKMMLGCAPFLEDWERIRKNAIANGDMECSFD